MKDETGTEVLRYELHEVWPSSWAMVDIGTEEWTLTYEQLMRKLPE